MVTIVLTEAPISNVSAWTVTFMQQIIHVVDEVVIDIIAALLFWQKWLLEGSFLMALLPDEILEIPKLSMKKTFIT